MPERLARCVEKRDVPGLLEVARRPRRARAGRRRAAGTARRAPRSGSHDERPSTLRRLRPAWCRHVQVEAVLCVALAPPASAAKWLRWEWLTQVRPGGHTARRAPWPRVVRRLRRLPPTRCRRAADSWGLSQADVRGPARRPSTPTTCRRPPERPFVEGWMHGDAPRRSTGSRASRARPTRRRSYGACAPNRALTDLVAPDARPPTARPARLPRRRLRDARRTKACWHASSSSTCAWPVSTPPAGRPPRRRCRGAGDPGPAQRLSCPAAWPGCSSCWPPATAR